MGVWKLRLLGVSERRVQGLGLRVLGSNDDYYKELYRDYSRDPSSDCRGLGFRVQGLGFVRMYYRGSNHYQWQ